MGSDNLLTFLPTQYYDPQDLLIASRRVKVAICAFGGPTNSAPSSQRDRDSIFRGVDRWSHQYESRLHKRYHLNGSHISWDAEEHPPIYVEPEHGIQQLSRGAERDKLQLSPEGSTPRDGGSLSTPSPTCFGDDDKTKMRYRCKLCGQPKQNHSCPYRQSMQRSIGVNVYPVVNAYTASEPGVLAPALSDMNNFVDRSEDDFQFTPETMRPSPSELRSPNSLPETEMTPPCSTSGGSVVTDNRKRKYVEVDHEESATPRQVSPFAQTASLCREQYRAVSVTPKEGSFEYPPLAVSFQERKRLSDTLFALSKEIRHLNDEVASILHEARERELWDLAVAEVMTQVVVALYCGEGDKRLDGLQHYMLGVGIAC